MLQSNTVPHKILEEGINVSYVEISYTYADLLSL